MTSYVQIRGSIPLFWQQLATVKYTPAVELTGDEEAQAAAFARHFTRQVGLYGDVVIVNLIDKKSDQLGLGEGDWTDPICRIPSLSLLSLLLLRSCFWQALCTSSTASASTTRKCATSGECGVAGISCECVDTCTLWLAAVPDSDHALSPSLSLSLLLASRRRFDFHAECAKMKWHNLSKLVRGRSRFGLAVPQSR